jgi:hypothetical protein
MEYAITVVRMLNNVLSAATLITTSKMLMFAQNVVSQDGLRWTFNSLFSKVLPVKK